MRSLTEHIDTGSAAGELFYYILGAFAHSSGACYGDAPLQVEPRPRAGANISGALSRSRRRRSAKHNRCSLEARARITSRAFYASGDRRFTARLRLHDARGPFRLAAAETALRLKCLFRSVAPQTPKTSAKKAPGARLARAATSSSATVLAYKNFRKLRAPQLSSDACEIRV
jgi:hypothetical protein